MASELLQAKVKKKCKWTDVHHYVPTQRDPRCLPWLNFKKNQMWSKSKLEAGYEGRVTQGYFTNSTLLLIIHRTISVSRHGDDLPPSHSHIWKLWGLRRGIDQNTTWVTMWICTIILTSCWGQWQAYSFFQHQIWRAWLIGRKTNLFPKPDEKFPGASEFRNAPGQVRKQG